GEKLERRARERLREALGVGRREPGVLLAEEDQRRRGQRRQAGLERLQGGHALGELRPRRQHGGLAAVARRELPVVLQRGAGHALGAREALLEDAVERPAVE